jgi:uncharacterized protein YunC (DUF1805 family)
LYQINQRNNSKYLLKKIQIIIMINEWRQICAGYINIHVCNAVGDPAWNEGQPLAGPKNVFGPVKN